MTRQMKILLPDRADVTAYMRIFADRAGNHKCDQP